MAALLLREIPLGIHLATQLLHRPVQPRPTRAGFLGALQELQGLRPLVLLDVGVRQRQQRARILRRHLQRLLERRRGARILGLLDVHDTLGAQHLGALPELRRALQMVAGVVELVRAEIGETPVEQYGLQVAGQHRIVGQQPQRVLQALDGIGKLAGVGELDGFGIELRRQRRIDRLGRGRATARVAAGRGTGCRRGAGAGRVNGDR